jgi:hypothetical protein
MTEIQNSKLRITEYDLIQNGLKKKIEAIITIADRMQLKNVFTSRNSCFGHWILGIGAYL